MLGLYPIGLLGATTLVARMILARITNGDAGLRLSSRTRGWAAVASLTMVGAWVFAVGAAALGNGTDGPLQSLGLVTFGCGLALMTWAQLAMGASWRIGVDPAERTELIVHGPFRAVRNPIFTGMVVALTGIGLVGPIVSLAAPLLFLAGVEIQTRLVEEPYLRSTHREYGAYAARVGRFVPVRDLRVP
ncbi:MAG: methyltransferase family protein [Acidimicrobiales bacterium]